MLVSDRSVPVLTILTSELGLGLGRDSRLEIRGLDYLSGQLFKAHGNILIRLKGAFC